jgi:aryl-alcohol dehydrogenase-like predicted oxidoreductase
MPKAGYRRPYYPLAAGFLSGKYRSPADLSKSRRGASDTVKRYLDDRGLSVLKALDAAARKYDASNATVALAWLLHRESVTAPIVSATNLDQLEEALAASQLALDAESMARSMRRPRTLHSLLRQTEK